VPPPYLTKLQQHKTAHLEVNCHCNIYNFPLSVPPPYRIELQQHKTAHLEVNCHCIFTQQQERL